MVRFIGTDRKDIVPRHAGNYTAAGLAAAMKAALIKQKKDVPAWFQTFTVEQGALKRGARTAIFGMG